MSASGSSYVPNHVVMLVARFPPDLGGLEKQAMLLARALVHNNVRVSVVTRNYGGYPRQEVIDGINVYRTPLIGTSPVLASLSYSVFSLIWLLRNRKSYKLIHCYQTYSPTIIGVIAKMILQKKVITKVTASREMGEVDEIERLPLTGIRKWLLRKVDKFVVVNQQIIYEMKRLGVHLDHIVHIPNGVIIPKEKAFVRAEKEDKRRNLGLDFKKIIVFAGRLSSEKGLDTLIDAWAEIREKIPEAHLILLGEGGTVRNVEPDLRNLVSKLKLNDRVHFWGKVDNVTDFLVAADVFVLPSISEGMSNALLEAMAIGTAIVTTLIDAHIGLIRDGVNGILIEPRNKTQLAQAIIRLLSDSQLRDNLGKSARNDAEHFYSISSVVSQYLKIYSELLHGKN